MLTGPVWRGLPLMRMQVAPTRPSPLRSVTQPLLMTLVRGHVQVHGTRAQPHGVGTSTLLPAAAEAGDDRWSTDQASEFIAVWLPLNTCAAQLPELPSWAQPCEAPKRFHDPRVVHWVDELRQQALQGEPLGSLYTEAVSAALLAYLHARYGGPAETAAPQPARGTAAAMLRLQRHITRHLDQPLRLTELARLAGCSPAHLNRLFKAQVGLPVHRYVLQQRVALACSLLSRPGPSLAEVALACGFASQAHLTQAFKAAMGTTPGAWRRAR